MRSGFACIVGRPNVGKSTLTNALVGQKVAITSDRPQTTRHTIRGIVTNSEGQLILIDTPGVHKPKTLLGQRLNQVVDQSMDSVDIVIMCIPADETSGAGDTFIAAEIAKHPKAKKFAVITKTDLISKEKLAVRLLGIMKIAEGFVWDEIIPVSAAIHDQVDLLNELIGKNLPAGPQYYPEGTTSDQAIEQLICEFIREAALQDVREELPHSIVVTIDEFGEREEKGSRPFFDVHATIHVERDTQRAILLGHQGARLKEIGIRARADIERALAAKIFLGLHIKVSKEWQKDPKLLAKLGFGEKS